MTDAPGAADRPGMVSDPVLARILWRIIEPVHAVIYFDPDCRQQLAATGLRGFWMGYFGSRAAPLGAVGPELVSAAFFNFNPSMVERAIPDTWVMADLPVILQARRAAAAAVLRRVAPSVDDRVAGPAALLRRMVDVADGSGRILFSANRALDLPDDPVEALWQLCTTLREHRGDGHVAALTAAGLSGCEALVLFARSEGLPDTMFREARGWSSDQWEAARRALEGRGLLSGDRTTPDGRQLRRSIEEETDALAGRALAVLTPEERSALVGGLQPVADAVADAAVITYPNPMGLPAPGR
jgi:hypothetical protein